MSMVKMTINDQNMTLTEEEQRELDAAEALRPAYDEDCPEMTAEKLSQFVHMSNEGFDFPRGRICDFSTNQADNTRSVPPTNKKQE